MKDPVENYIPELTEAEALYEMHSYPSSEDMLKCGGSVIRIGSITCIRTDAFAGFSVNRVTGFTAIPDNETLEVIMKFYSGRKGIYAIQIPPALVSHDTEKMLTERGFYLKNNWARFVRDTSPVKGFSTKLSVKEIGEDEGASFARIVNQTFDFPPSLDAIMSSCIGKEGWKFYMAYDSGKPVATGCVFTRGETAWNCLAATLPEYRGMGAQAALLSRRIEFARESGCKFITTETHFDNASYRNMIRYGYKLIYARPNFVYGE